MGDVHEHRSPDHDDQVAGRDHRDQGSGEHQDAADDLDDGHEGRRDDRHRDAHGLEALGCSAEAVDEQLLVAVREHDRGKY